MAGKRGSRRHFTTSFSENVVVAETSFQMLGLLSLNDRERASRSLPQRTFLGGAGGGGITMKHSGVCIFREQARKLN